MLRWLRFQFSERLQATNRDTARWLMYAVAAVLVLVMILPAQATTISDPPRLAPAQTTSPQRLNFVGDVAQVQGTVMLNQNQEFIFFGQSGQRVQVQLLPNPGVANFEVRGSNGIVYKALSDPDLDWSFTLPETQDYRITVASSTPVLYTLIVTLNSTTQPTRITFLPGQTVATVSGTASPSQSPQYVFNAGAAQTIRILLTSPGNLANFSVRGVSDGVTYKQLTNPSRDWTFVTPSAQDYLITITAGSIVSFLLQVTIPGPPTPGERINFAPGQTVATVSGTLTPGVPKTYIFGSSVGNVRVLLTLQAGGSATFAVVGVSNGIVYKQQADPTLDFTFYSPINQDYFVTLLSQIVTAYTLQITIPAISPPTITPLPPIPAGCTSDTIQNGGFENNAFWIFGDSPVPPAYESIVVHTTLRSVRLGIDPNQNAAVKSKESFSSIRQPFQLSSQAVTAQLRWWQFSRTEEAVTNSTSPGEDSQQVMLLARDKSTVAVLRSVRNNAGAWQEQLVDLTPYLGKSLLLYFNVFNDGNGQNTWQYVDDVVISVCYPAMTATPVVPTAVPTMVPPTAVPPTVVLPTMVFPSPIAPTLLATLALAPIVPQSQRGEPQVETVAPAPPTRTPLPTRTPIAVVAALPNLLATPQVTVSLWFGRSPTEVLTWTAIMIGALAVIGLLVGLILQYVDRNRGP